MQKIQQTLLQKLQNADNDYTSLENVYRNETGSELVLDPYASMHVNLHLTLSASIIIPAFNSSSTLERCLIAIEQSSFNRKYPKQLEVIVVDDGSSDGTWELIEKFRFSMSFKAMRQDHQGSSSARNTAIMHSKGDILIFCDSDMILTPFSIEELVKRHQILENVLLVGFRSDINARNPHIQPSVLHENLQTFLPPFLQDKRLDDPWGNWHQNICRSTNHFKNFGRDKQFFMLGGAWATLPSMVWGALFSLSRKDTFAIGGFSEDFQGWGYEDGLFGAQAIALGNYIVPVYSAAGFHITHSDRLSNKWESYVSNYHIFRKALYAPFATYNYLKRNEKSVQCYFEPLSDNSLVSEGTKSFFNTALLNPWNQGEYNYALGRYTEAIAAYTKIIETNNQDKRAAFCKARALCMDGSPDQAIKILEHIIEEEPTHTEAVIEMALALATLNQFARAGALLKQAQQQAPTNGLIQYILEPFGDTKPFEKATLYTSQKDYTLAIEEYEFALIYDPLNVAAQIGRIKALKALKKVKEADSAFNSYLNTINTKNPNATKYIQQALSQLISGQMEEVKLPLELARRQLQLDQEDKSNLINQIQCMISEKNPLPLASQILRSSEKIIGGDYTREELELLIALTMRVVTCNISESRINLIDLGSSCGQAAVTIGLTVKGLGRTDIQLIAVDEFSTIPNNDHLPARVILYSRAIANRLIDIIAYSPEEDPTPWELSSRLLLVNLKDDYASLKDKVALYLANLAPGGLFLLHHYTDSFPHVQRYADELLTNHRFKFIAQSGGLIAFIYRN